MSKNFSRIFYRGNRARGEVPSRQWQRQTAPRKQTIQAWRLLVLFCCLAFFMIDCAKKPPATKPKPKRPPAARPVPPPKEPEALNPKREASQNMIRLGENYLSQGDLEKAEQTFQEAANIDPDNGLAYYYLAKVMYQKSDYDDALGVLEKSEGLLSAYPEWVAEVTRLKAQIIEAKQNPPVQTEQPAGGVYY